MIHDDRIEAFDAASQLIEGLKVHQEKEIEKKVTKTLNKLTTTSKNSGGKRNPRSKRETTVSQNIYIYIKKSTICCINRLIDFGLGNQFFQILWKPNLRILYNKYIMVIFSIPFENITFCTEI